MLESEFDTCHVGPVERVTTIVDTHGAIGSSGGYVVAGVFGKGKQPSATDIDPEASESEFLTSPVRKVEAYLQVIQPQEVTIFNETV